jgi:hypothetical protein
MLLQNVNAIENAFVFQTQIVLCLLKKIISFFSDKDKFLGKFVCLLVWFPGVTTHYVCIFTAR